MGVSLGAAAAAAGELACAAEQSAAGAGGGSESLLKPNPLHPEPAPVGVDRLPLDWYKATAQRLKDRVAPKGVDVVLLQDDNNIVYFTGCFRQSGERTTWVMMPLGEKDTVYWFSPGIDRDLIQSWWCTENEYYFCYPPVEGVYPNKGQLSRGKGVDVWEWTLTRLKRRGLDGKTIGLDVASPARLEALKAALPNSRVVDIGGDCLGMRLVKTKEEIALTMRAYRYFDRVHAFARDYILEHGTRATDYEVGQALAQYGIGLMMKDVRRDGRPHSAVGIDVTSNYVRAGVATAYPHPNQFFHARIERGKPLYVNCDILLGGYGGELYRNYVIAPFDPYHDKLWQVVSDTVQIMVEETVPGRTCADVAYKVHEYQIKSGLQACIYHRPGHGQGQNYEGHQPPYLALGDDTPIVEGMTFSVEPGLYDEKAGIGVNPSDRLLVLKDKAVLMSRVPFSKEWSFLRL
jgi:Xaa-Pro aminopeptidase